MVKDVNKIINYNIIYMMYKEKTTMYATVNVNGEIKSR